MRKVFGIGTTDTVTNINQSLLAIYLNKKFILQIHLGSDVIRYKNFILTHVEQKIKATIPQKNVVR